MEGRSERSIILERMVAGTDLAYGMARTQSETGGMEIIPSGNNQGTVFTMYLSYDYSREELVGFIRGSSYANLRGRRVYWLGSRYAYFRSILEKTSWTFERTDLSVDIEANVFTYSRSAFLEALIFSPFEIQAFLERVYDQEAIPENTWNHWVHSARIFFRSNRDIANLGLRDRVPGEDLTVREIIAYQVQFRYDDDFQPI